MSMKKVLIVDADKASRAYLTRVLEQKNYAVLDTPLAKEGLIFAWRDHPDLILADPQLSDLPGEDLIRKLRADPRSSSIPAIALSSDPRPSRRETCLNAGFNEYLTKTSENIPALMRAVDIWLAPPDEFLPEEKRRLGALLITFISAKGGTGVSSLCANLAMQVRHHEREARVAVFDSVLPIGSIASIVGYDGQMDITSLAAMPPEKTDASFLRENLPDIPGWNFRLLPGSPHPERASSLHGERVEQIVQTLKTVYDYVFIDVGRSLSNIILPFILQSDLVVLVVSPDLSAVKLSRLVCQYLESKGLPRSRLYVILNRVVGFEGVTKPEVEGLLNLKIQTTVPHLGGNFSLANNQRMPFSLKFPSDSASIIIKEAAVQITTLASRIRAEALSNAL